MQKVLDDKKIIAEYEKLSALFVGLTPNKRALLDGLIRQAAAMWVLMQDCIKEMRQEGLLTITENASQRFVKPHPAAKTYIDASGKYKALMETLCGHLPAETVKSASRLKALLEHETD